jgi:hypothetical protein
LISREDHYEKLGVHEKGALLQREEDIPSGSCCFQPEGAGEVTAGNGSAVEASGAKGPRNGDQRARRLKYEMRDEQASKKAM